MNATLWKRIMGARMKIFLFRMASHLGPQPLVVISVSSKTHSYNVS